MRNKSSLGVIPRASANFESVESLWSLIRLRLSIFGICYSQLVLSLVSKEKSLITRKSPSENPH